MAVGDVFYWPSYHAYFAALGDAEQRGQQVGAREALAAVVGIGAPLIGAWALVTVGPGPPSPRLDWCRRWPCCP